MNLQVPNLLWPIQKTELFLLGKCTLTQQQVFYIFTTEISGRHPLVLLLLLLQRVRVQVQQVLLPRVQLVVVQVQAQHPAVLAVRQHRQHCSNCGNILTMLVPVKNIDSHEIVIPFEGTTYSLPKGKTVMIPKSLFDFLKERFPLSFDFEVQVKKAAPAVKKTKTPSLLKRTQRVNEDMQVIDTRPKEMFGGADITPPGGSTDSDGVAWYGGGIEVETGPNLEE